MTSLILELKFDCCPPSTSYISFQSSSGNFFQSQARIFFKTIHFSPMEHQISLSICLQEGQVQSCTVIRCDSRHERGDPTSPPLPSYLPSSSFPKEPLPMFSNRLMDFLSPTLTLFSTPRTLGPHLLARIHFQTIRASMPSDLQPPRGGLRRLILGYSSGGVSSSPRFGSTVHFTSSHPSGGACYTQNGLE